MLFTRLVVLCLMILAPFVRSDMIADQLEFEIDGYIHELQSKNLSMVSTAADKVSASGLSDKRLFEEVQKVLLEVHQRQLQTPSDKSLSPPVISLLRALASSGDFHYTAAINRLRHESKSRSARNRAKHVLGKMSWYSQRNKIMQDMSTHRKAQSLLSTRYLNMLNYSDLNMNRYAAEELYRLGAAEGVVTDQIWSDFQKGVREDKGKLHVDVMAWYCRVSVKLARESYRAEIEQLIDDKSVNAKIRRHCEKELSR